MNAIIKQKFSANDFRRLKFKMRMWCRGLAVVVLTGGFTAYNIFADFKTFNHQRNLSESGCPLPADPKALAVLYSIGVLYLFIALAIIADEFFVPALDVIGEWWDLSPDVAGATLMAAGGSAPELFTSAVGTFLRSSVGFGAIVGSAVFNILFVVGICAILTTEPMQLTWYPMIRDATYYCLTLVVLAIFFGVTTPQVIEWWEAVVLHLMYWVYVTMMMYNKQVYHFITGKSLGESEDDNGADGAISASHEVVNFSCSSKFRSGLLRMLTSNKSIFDTAGTYMITKISGNVDEAFKRFDTDGNGTIDKKEMKALLSQLGCNVNDENVDEIVSSLDKDNKGSIDFHEFSLWYLSSKERVRGDVDACFKAADMDGDGILTVTELRSLLTTLGHAVSDEDVVDLIKKINHDGGGSVALNDFKAWYESSAFWTEAVKRGETMEEAAEGLSLYPPKDAGCSAMAWYIITLPLVLVFSYSVVDVRRPGLQKYAYFTFFMCLVWMGFFSYFMVSWVETIGATAGIPSVIMGLTFLAAGTSVPDMLSALIVAKQGEGDKAVSSSIGSNVFDIAVGLALPWVLFWIVYQEPIYVSAGDLFISIIILVVAMIIVIVTLRLRNWLLPPSTGYFFIFLYCCFVAQQLARTTWGQC